MYCILKLKLAKCDLKSCIFYPKQNFWQHMSELLPLYICEDMYKKPRLGIKDEIKCGTVPLYCYVYRNRCSAISSVEI